MLTPRCGAVEILRFAQDDNVVDLALPAAARAPTKETAPGYVELLLVIVRIGRMLRDHDRILLQRLQCELDGLFELPVVARRN